jgi:hypothetical protein
MRYFSLMDFQHLVIAFFLGLGFVIVLYTAWIGYPDRGPEETDGRLEEDSESTRHGVFIGMKSQHGPVSPFLIIVYAGVAIWVLAYAIFVGVLGGPIG